MAALAPVLSGDGLTEAEVGTFVGQTGKAQSNVMIRLRWLMPGTLN